MSPLTTLLPATISILLLPLTLLIPPTILPYPFHAALSLPPILAYTYHIYTRYNIRFLPVLYSLWALELLLFRRPRENLALLHVSRTVKSTTKNENGDDNDKVPIYRTWKESYPKPLWKRLQWILKLIFSPRYLGWDINCTTKPNPALQTQATVTQTLIWLLNRTLTTSLSFILWDLTNYYQYHDPYFQILTPVTEPLPRRLQTFLSSYNLGFLPPKLVRLTVYAVQQFSVLEFVFGMLSLAMVGLGMIGAVDEFWGGVDMWKCVVGDPGLLFLDDGLRGFWREVWGGLMGNLFSGPARFILYISKLHPTSLSHSILHILTKFLSIALFHYILASNSNTKPLNYALFFILHGILLIFEAITLSISKPYLASIRKVKICRAGLKIGSAIWVLTVLYLTAALYVDEHVKELREVGWKGIFLFNFHNDMK